MMVRDGEGQATADDLIVESSCGRQASNVRGRGIQSYTYLRKHESELQAGRSKVPEGSLCKHVPPHLWQQFGSN